AVRSRLTSPPMKDVASPSLLPARTLALPSACCLAVIGAHSFADGHNNLEFLARNLFLAWIRYVLALAFQFAARLRTPGTYHRWVRVAPVFSRPPGFPSMWRTGVTTSVRQLPSSIRVSVRDRRQSAYAT